MKNIKKSPPKLAMLRQKELSLMVMLQSAFRNAREKGVEPMTTGISAALRKVREEISVEVSKEHPQPAAGYSPAGRDVYEGVGR